MNMGPRLSLSKGIHSIVADQSHGLIMIPVSIEQLRATLRQKSIRSQKQSETKLDGSLKYIVQTKSSHQQTWNFNLMFTNNKKEDGIYPLKRDSNTQNKDQRSIVTTCKNTYKGFAFSTY
jgi:hypothetical protein